MTQLILAGWMMITMGPEVQRPRVVESATWTQFRGPDGQGHIRENIPTRWSENTNVAWKTTLKGKGWSSPVVAAGKIWVTTSVPVSEKGISLRVIGVDLQSGEIKTDVEMFAVSAVEPLHARNTPASPTPTIVGNRLVASFGKAGIGCLDTLTGKILWKNDKLKVNYETGAGSSPVPYKDRVILTCDGADVQFVVALDVATGVVKWKTDRPAASQKKPNERRAFSTPLVITVGKQDQVVIPGAHCVYSYDPDTGKELWRVRYTGFSNVPRPVFAHGLVIISTGYYAHELLAIRPTGSGDVTETHIVWRFKKTVPNVPSPIIVGDELLMVSDKGIATCLNAKSGDLKWTQRLQGNFTASLLAHGDTILAFADDGKAVLFKAGGKFQRVGVNELQGRIQATPAAADGSLIVRTEDALYRIKTSSGRKSE